MPLFAVKKYYFLELVGFSLVTFSSDRHFQEKWGHFNTNEELFQFGILKISSNFITRKLWSKVLDLLKGTRLDPRFLDSQLK